MLLPVNIYILQWAKLPVKFGGLDVLATSEVALPLMIKGTPMVLKFQI
jgi:hypothetical protein